MSTLADRLWTALEAKTWSPADLDREIGAGSGPISKWLNGKQEPGAESLAKLCHALEISGHWLLLDEGGMAAPGAAQIGPIEQARLEVRVEFRRRVLEAVEAALPTEPPEAEDGSLLSHRDRETERQQKAGKSRAKRPRKAG